MFRTLVEFVLLLAAAYLVAGVVFAAAFHARGLRRLDAGSHAAGGFFRVLITPGVIALWPLLAWKWRRAVVGGASFAGGVEGPVAPRRLRALHGQAMKCLAVLAPLLAVAALYWRPAATAPALEAIALPSTPPPLPRIIAGPRALFSELPISARLLGDDQGRRQLELTVARDLEIPTLALYWSPRAVAEELPPDGVFLGSVWGPGVRRFPLKFSAPGRGGSLYLVALSQEQRVVVSAPMPEAAMTNSATAR